MTKRADTPQRMNRDRRAHFVSATAVILAEGQPTYFRNEAACRYGLRVRFIGESWTWSEADDLAADIVAVALRAIGAKRPSWAEGQPAWTQDAFAPVERTRCRRCAKQLSGPESHWGWAKEFCSTLCADAARKAGECRNREEFHEAARCAGLAKKMRRERPCEECGTWFIPPRPKGRFCGNACARRHVIKMQGRRLLDDKNCQSCGVRFHPLKESQKACSQSCGAKLRSHGPERSPQFLQAPASSFRCEDATMLVAAE
ncbi:hypothetical protein [Mesorhizobium sp. IMUNJ 23232]|uniref:hypothetical protein n=1 Tax=Mesorhizobium sp. IMUNJ 23232 TaxID=3376064 RepID=UPI0037B8A3E2